MDREILMRFVIIEGESSQSSEAETMEEFAH